MGIQSKDNHLPIKSRHSNLNTNTMVVTKTREEFIVWIRLAINDRECGAYEELYQFLTSCFVRSDSDKDGRVTVAHFDDMIEEAAQLPRMYGYAPKSEDMFSNANLRKAARASQFKQMDTKGTGYITLNQWIRFAIDHIMKKYIQLPKDYLSASAADVTKEEFIAFIKKAVDTNSQEYKELYYFLLRTFQAGDKGGYGEVEPAEFDEMIECAAAAPRRFGLAPPTSEMFKSEQARLINRMTLFSQMDTTSTGKITFDGWLNFAMEHIMGKVRGL